MENINEKAKSKSQQRLFGMVATYNKKSDKEKKEYLESLPKSLADKIKGIADGSKRKTGDKRKNTKSISKKDAQDFAKTKHEDLPEKVSENKDVQVTNDNKEEIIKELLKITEYSEKELSEMPLSELEDLYNSIVVKKLENISIKKFNDFINENDQYLEGGNSDGMTLEDIAEKHNVDVKYFYKHLDDMIKIEMEHTDDKEMAKKIVMDHLDETPLYYHEKHGLPEMEERLENMDKEEVDEIISSQMEEEQKIKRFDDFK